MEGPVNIRRFVRRAQLILLTALCASAVAWPGAPASAQGLFDFLFGAVRRPAPTASAYADPSQSNPFGRRSEQESRSGGAVAYCVRLCDGRFFPIQRSSGADPAQVCSSFCPAAKTKIFSGGSIEHAAAPDGTRYPDLRSAFSYRERIVPDCSCNGKDSAGLAATPAAGDPTLRAGDIVATESGFVTYTGNKRHNAEFTPLTGEMRARLADTRIMPADASAAPLRTTLGPDGPERRLQASR
jgi:hypothetical protein